MAVRRVAANGIEIACEVTGSGPPIVLCHGGEADHRNFFNFAPVLAERFTVIAYDQRDTGETRHPPEPYALVDLGRDVGGLIAGLGYERAHVFGTSFGGVIAQQAAIHCPERIDRLILSVTWCGPEAHVTDEFYAFALRPKTPEETKAYWKMFFSPGFATAHPDQVEALMSGVIYTRSPEQRVRRGGTLAGGYDASGDLPKLTCPTLVLQGGDDQIVLPAAPRKVAALIPGAELRVLEGIGHAVTIEAPERVAAEIGAFIDRTSA